MRRATWWPPLRYQVADEFRRLGVFDMRDILDFQVRDMLRTDAETEQRRALKRQRSSFVAPPCPGCGTKVRHRRDGRGRQRLYCSPKCQWKAFRKPRAKKLGKCRHCGKQMTEGSPQRRYCNRACKRAHARRGA
jgi:hypothetical protein